MKDRNILIVGFTKRTSFALAKALLSMGNRVLISDSVDNPEKHELLAQLSPHERVVGLLGNQDPKILSDYLIDMVMPSPGVPLTIALIAEARAKGIPVIGDIELFTSLFPNNLIVGITGTDGKTTTTTLTYEILRQERKTIAGGNIGIPIFEYFNQITPDTVIVLELSSFQLEAVRSFHPNIAAVLNIAADHLDRYPSIIEYMLAKKNIFNNQTDADTAVLNLDSPYYGRLSEGIKSRILTFSTQSKLADIYYYDHAIYYLGKRYLDRKDIRMKGDHNVENAMAAILMVKSIGISDHSIKNALTEFAGVEHRIEFVCERGGVSYYNDSKATTVNAMEKAILSFDEPLILIAGGRDKGLDFKPLRELVKNKLKHLILIGEATQKIIDELGFEPYTRARDMEEAVHVASGLAVAGDSVLLSPGCASFDMYQNYEERGRHYKEICLNK